MRYISEMRACTLFELLEHCLYQCLPTNTIHLEIVLCSSRHNLTAQRHTVTHHVIKVELSCPLPYLQVTLFTKLGGKFNAFFRHLCIYAFSYVIISMDCEGDHPPAGCRQQYARAF